VLVVNRRHLSFLARQNIVKVEGMLLKEERSVKGVMSRVVTLYT